MLLIGESDFFFLLLYSLLFTFFVPPFFRNRSKQVDLTKTHFGVHIIDSSCLFIETWLSIYSSPKLL